MTAHSGLIDGRFERGDAIGRGASGTVYRGVDTLTGEVVAIKLLDSADPGLGELLANEAALLKTLSHPCIVRLQASGTHDGTPYLVTEYVAGGSLRDLITREQQLPISRALAIAVDLADALHHAHEHAVIHRDVKPSNVLLASDGTPRLTDFGVATVVHPMALGRRSDLVGTLAYLSPEGFHGEALGRESDVWSLGLVLYEMMAGSLPFGVPTSEADIPALAGRPAPLISQFRPEVPDTLVSLLCNMLEHDRSARAGDARVVAGTLGKILSGLETHGEERPGVPAGTNGGPVPQIPFLGRVREQHDLLSLLTSGTHRLISLIGPGGIGKTRLAMETAALVAEVFPDGVHLVALAPVPAPALMVPAIAAAVGLNFKGAADPRAQLIEFLKDRKILLVLDNMEHLLEGVSIIRDIIDAGPAVAVLATSREQLGHPHETIVELRGLGVPPLDDALNPAMFAALELFAHAAARSSEAFVPHAAEWAAIASICRLVEGNPLGIELAAASVSQAPCETIARRLAEDVDFLTAALPGLPSRHRSMRAVFDHSWTLLRESERGVFRRLAIFRGGFTLPAARAVAGSSLATLSSLVSKSLLSRGSDKRYALHELLRQYAKEELERSPRELTEVEELYTEFYGTFVQEREAALQAASEREVFGEVEVEMPNIRAAWECALSIGHGECTLPYLRGMHRFFEHRSRFREGEDAFANTVAVLRDAFDEETSGRTALAVALTCWSALLYRLARFEQARDVANEARALSETIGLKIDVVSAANTAGIACIALGETREAESLITQALGTWEEIGNLQGQGACHTNLGIIADGLGRIDEAIEHYERALAIFTQIDHKPGKTTVLQNLTGMALQRGDLDAISRLAGEALIIARSVGDRLAESRALATLGIAAHRGGDEEGAIRRFEEGIAIKRELGDSRGLANTLAHLGVSLASRGLHDCARAIFEEAYDEAEAIGDRHHQAMALMFRADHCVELDESVEAERCYRQALAIALETGSLPQVTEVVRAIAHLKDRFGDMAGALEAFLVGRAQPFYEDARSLLDEAIAQLETSLPNETVAQVRTRVATYTLEAFANKLLSEPPWS